LFGLTTPLSAAPPAPEGLSYRFASGDELTRLGGMTPEAAAVAVRSGDRCLLQFLGDGLVGYAWVAVSPVVFLTEGVYLPLPADAAYVYKTFTLPDARGGRLQPLRTLELRRRLAAEGRPRCLCYVDDANLESLRGVARAGYEVVGEVRLVPGRAGVHVQLELAREWWTEVRGL
jgi:hypothetical protein